MSKPILLKRGDLVKYTKSNFCNKKLNPSFTVYNVTKDGQIVWARFGKMKTIGHRSWFRKVPTKCDPKFLVTRYEKD